MMAIACSSDKDRFMLPLTCPVCDAEILAARKQAQLATALPMTNT